MGDPLASSDFLAAALRQSRNAVADDGFSLRVARQVRTERRRVRWARVLPVVMAFLGVTLTSALTGLTAFHLGSQLPGMVGPLEEAAGQLAPFCKPIAHLGLPPWTILAALGAFGYALLPRRQEDRGAFRF